MEALSPPLPPPERRPPLRGQFSGLSPVFLQLLQHFLLRTVQQRHFVGRLTPRPRLPDACKHSLHSDEVVTSVLFFEAVDPGLCPVDHPTPPSHFGTERQ